jgi:hypothetical protein
LNDHNIKKYIKEKIDSKFFESICSKQLKKIKELCDDISKNNCYNIIRLINDSEDSELCFVMSIFDGLTDIHTFLSKNKSVITDNIATDIIRLIFILYDNNFEYQIKDEPFETFITHKLSTPLNLNINKHKDKEMSKDDFNKIVEQLKVKSNI